MCFSILHVLNKAHTYDLTDIFPEIIYDGELKKKKSLIDINVNNYLYDKTKMSIR